MKTIYIDTDYKCYTQSSENLIPIETDIFDDKCKVYIEGCRFIPMNETWTREDGIEFKGEMVSFWKPHSQLISAQQQYEEDLIEISDMQTALELLGV